MSVAFEGIWFPIADNHHPHNPINDQLAGGIQATINPHETIPGKAGGNRKPSIQFPIADNNHSHNPINDQPADNIQPAINPSGSQSATGSHQSIQVTGPRLDLRPRQPWWMDIPNWSPTDGSDFQRQ
jgi:hypothetical protein